MKETIAAMKQAVELHQGMVGSRMDNRGQGNLAGLFVGVMVAAIIGIAVVIPVINDVIADANLSGTTETIVTLIPLFVALLLIIALAGPLMRRA